MRIGIDARELTGQPAPKPVVVRPKPGIGQYAVPAALGAVLVYGLWSFAR